MTSSTEPYEHLISPFRSRLDELRRHGSRVVASSSFQTQSMPLLHLISRHAPHVPVHFLDTGFHFVETLQFRDLVAERLSLNVITVESPVPKIAQRTTSGMLLWASDTDRCCHLNKTLPMEPVLQAADVWITGVRRDQSNVRAAFEFETPGPHGVTRLHPMLDWTRRDIWRYVADFDLPRHPLELLGYESIGCAPCTQAPSLDPDERSGRWHGQRKTECGLHTELVSSPI